MQVHTWTDALVMVSTINNFHKQSDQIGQREVSISQRI